MTKKNRLDVHLLTKGLAPSREQAQKLIRAGKVRDAVGNILDKPGQEVSKELEIIVQSSPRFVSRGGEKLDAALTQFPIEVSKRICIDAGISTGGFTDCLLKRGASLVYGIDVGYGQIAWTLRNDSRVVLRERTNIRYLKHSDLYGPSDPLPSLAVADLSFISLRIVLPAIKSLLQKSKQEALLLVKPQFEVGPERVGKGGVVRDAQSHMDALNAIIDFSRSKDWKTKGAIASPIKGPAGNHEYLLWLSNEGVEQKLNTKKLVVDTLNLKS
ncbi:MULTISPECIES: TlyA family rRNA (cytidine-2'-O)-methyltransferase [Prochlorococcus]|uniref:Predicted rRNA methylase n=1 Tax=Prochlorococcus marinus (strain SARG / CCMP1375 / SS120) TaxID=167539 RepID=Q7VA50_PROMA|nr:MULTISPECIES: TlyA family rRNA (cytidine-2'-O)-methyltransferase [Prochlorococcus]AAQ00661.1 Predicted rRNA methylase [Prochlorococcus marinus subsp. marinus str. CCMP1375]KGG10844.1 RNA binding methyltransferase FtsJ like [Prochlorococcus marinus str. LG]KGG20423.1 RNA binding methyltransferase FtsJ like [Prochlorococcus marinus str. SS2]KGG24092.1 RNA binding methyltransferase FtsJ like [Prochlorococcus marinus str. SS35]KGG31649.1 RNA binding methyltransferase FtsJ like [Prochlorococcus 